MTRPDLSDEQIDAEVQRLLSDPAEIRAMALRVRALEQERDAYKMLCESDRSLAGLIPLMKWGLDQSNEAGFLRVALSEAESRAEASAKDAEWLAKIETACRKSRLFNMFMEQNFWHAHHVDVEWRFNGKDVREEADWLGEVWYALRKHTPGQLPPAIDGAKGQRHG